MNVADVNLRYDTAQKMLKLHIETDAEDTSISDHYVLIHLPAGTNGAKSGWQVNSRTKVETETLYNDNLPNIGVSVNVTSGASEYDVRVAATAEDGTVYEATGKTGVPISLQIPIAGHADAEAVPHNSTLPPPEDTLAIDGDGNSVPGSRMFPVAENETGTPE